MSKNNIDKDFLFKTITTTIASEMGLNKKQMNYIMNTLTTTFENIDCVSTMQMLSVNNSSNSIIIKNFCGCKKMAGLSDNSIYQYTRSINKLIDFCKKDLIKIDTNDIRKFLLHYQKIVTKTTVDNCRRNINVFFKFMEEEEYILKNPCRKIPKIKDEIKYKRFYTDMEIEGMRDSCQTKKELALVDLLISTGLRVSEVCNIKIPEVDWENRTIIIHGKGGKDRVVPFSIRCKKHLQEYLLDRKQNGNIYLFCNRNKYKGMHKQSIQNLLKKIGKRIGLDNITVHCFRRWLASHLNKKGMDSIIIQEILGHKSFSTTKKHYLDKSTDRMCHAYNLVFS